MNNNVKSIEKVKSAIIGKAWRNSDVVGIMPASYTLPSEMVFNANESYLIGDLTFRTDRNTTIPVTVKAGQKLYFYANTKRAGKEDPDYSVSVLMSVEEAEAYIANSREGAEAWKEQEAAGTTVA